MPQQNFNTNTNKSNLNNKIKQYVSFGKKEFNILSMPSAYCGAGKYNIDIDNKNDYESFLDLISGEVINEKYLHFLEKPHREHNQVKIDLDLRFKPTNEELKENKFNRRYTTEFITSFVKIVIKEINALIESKEYCLYVQEKKNSRITKDKKIKEGIHIMIPDVVMHNNVLHKLRVNIINNSETKKIFNDIENISPIEEVIDKCIIDKNAWFLYGNGKSTDIINNYSDFYETTIMYKNTESGEIKKLKEKYITKLHNDYNSAIKLFSNFNKSINVTYNDNIDIDSIEEENLSQSITNYNSNIPVVQSTKRKNSTLTSKETQALINCISDKRADSFDSWWKIGLSLYNMDNRNFTIWNEFSKKSTKYNEKDVYDRWFNEFSKLSKKYGLGLHTLKNFAEEDNPTKYNEFYNLEKQRFLKTWLINIFRKEDYMNGKSFDMINMVNHIINYVEDYSDFMVVCGDPSTPPIWFKFINSRWVEDRSASSLYLLIRNSLRNEFKKLKNELVRKIQQERINSSNNSNYDSMNNEDQITYFQNVNNNINTESELIKILDKLLQFFQNINNKKNIILDMSYQCYDENFIGNLDTNKNIFICENGVIDLNTLTFRKGEISDMGTLYSKITYPIDMDEFEEMDIANYINEFLSKIFVDHDIKEYVLNVFAEKLSGENIREEFHIFTGSGSNGKSQFFQLISKTFGEYFLQFDNALLNKEKKDANSASPAIAELRGPRIAVTTEPKADEPFETDKIKELIGGDTLSARYPYSKKNIKFVPQYKMFMMCNDIPDAGATDDGFWRKIRVTPFESKFVVKQEDMYKLKDPEKFPNHFVGDSDLNDKLYEKWAPVFLKMLFNRFQNLKCNNFKYNTPPKVLQATEKYKSNSNVYENYYNERIKNTPGYFTTETDSYNDYKNFVITNNMGNVQSRKIFLTHIEKLVGKITNRKFLNYSFGEFGQPI